MENMNIQPGATVWLKTGGPAMTVKSKLYGGDWSCTWFVGNEVKHSSFSAAQLTTENPNPKSSFDVT